MKRNQWTMAMAENLFIGTAGWSIPKESAARLPGEGTHLERYARGLNAVEINSSFYRSHLGATYARWAASTPSGFRFAVKVPKEVTHILRLRETAPLDRFAAETAALGGKLGTWLLQLPPGLAFNPGTAGRFFDGLRARFAGEVACEPRHPTWFTPQAGQLLVQYRVARVAADPSIDPQGTRPGGWEGLIYYRLHGSPEMYRSTYSGEFLRGMAGMLMRLTSSAPVWCIFNNTAAGSAIENGLNLLELVSLEGKTGPIGKPEDDGLPR
jgi:uncharacterized protein YecE (DUF72 family)